MRHILFAALACVVALAFASPALAAEPFGGPYGEELVANSFAADNRYEFEVECDPGGISTVRFSVSGSAYGPYFGSFEELGSFTIGPQTRSEGRGDLLSFDASFVVSAGDTTVTGTKQLVTGVPGMGGTATCDPGSGRLFLDYADFAYTAEIRSPSETITEEGRGNVRIDAFSEAGSWTGQMEERFTDVLAGGQIATTLVLEPDGAVNPVGDPHEVTATVLDQEGAPIEAATVRFGTYGAVFAQGECTTAADGRCSFTLPGSDFPGTVTIEAYVDANQSGTYDGEAAGEPTTRVFKEYVLPRSTAGSAAGGGTAGGVTFELSVKSGPEAAKGTCTVWDAVTGEPVLECLGVLSYVQSGNAATVYGTGRTSSGETLYRITLVDNGEPGRGRDVFRVVTADGGEAGGVLESGNLRVR